MDTTDYTLKQLDESAAPMIRALFFSVFTKEPWNDDWSDEKQLTDYIHDLIGQNTSLTYGLFEGTELVGVSMGHVRHWYAGTQYYIDELCVTTDRQGKGIGTLLVDEIGKACKESGLTHLFLLTEDNVPAYEFYRKQGFYELTHNVAFAKEL